MILLGEIMKIRNLMVGSVALVIAACETVPTVPTKHPMTELAKTQIGNPDVFLAANHVGIGATWFQSQSNGGGAGLAGVLGAAIGDAIINAIPSSRATKIANEVSESIVADDLNSSLMNALNVAKENDANGTSLNVISLVNGLDKSIDNEGKIAISVNYQLSEDASAFKVIATAEYENAEVPYVTPYTFEGKVPKSHIEGPAYSNSFVFNSSQFEQPVLTEALKVELVKSVEDSFRDEEGNLPTEGGEFKKMQKNIKKAKDDKLTKPEISVFLIQNWLKNGGTPIKKEVEQAHQFIARYLVEDFNSTVIPDLDGEDKIVDTQSNGRVVKLVGQGPLSGSYVSEPGNVTSFTTYGNAVNYSKAGRAIAKLARKKK